MSQIRRMENPRITLTDANKWKMEGGYPIPIRLNPRSIHFNFIFNRGLHG